MQRFLPYVEELSETEEGRTLIAMVLDDLYHQVVHKSGAQAGEAQSRGDQQQSSKQPGGRNKRDR
jgi:hypothetical protein